MRPKLIKSFNPSKYIALLYSIRAEKRIECRGLQVSRATTICSCVIVLHEITFLLQMWLYTPFLEVLFFLSFGMYVMICIKINTVININLQNRTMKSQAQQGICKWLRNLWTTTHNFNVKFCNWVSEHPTFDSM